MHAIRNAETGEITTSVDFETIKEQLIEEYTEMIEAIGIVEFITAHEKAIAEAKCEELNEKDLKEAIVTNTVYPLILNLPESEKPLFMKIKYNALASTGFDENMDIVMKDKSKVQFNGIDIEEIGGK